jgi:hypothetical protein
LDGKTNLHIRKYIATTVFNSMSTNHEQTGNSKATNNIYKSTILSQTYMLTNEIARQSTLWKTKVNGSINETCLRLKHPGYIYYDCIASPRPRLPLITNIYHRNHMFVKLYWSSWLNMSLKWMCFCNGSKDEDDTIWQDALTMALRRAKWTHENVPSQGPSAIFWHAKDFATAHEVAARAWETPPAVIRLREALAMPSCTHRIIVRWHRDGTTVSAKTAEFG